ncbi:MAG: FliH/SctL family protein [Phycisphaerae bacterium]
MEIKLPAPLAEAGIEGAGKTARDDQGANQQAMEQLRRQMNKQLQQDRTALASAHKALQEAARELSEIQQKVIAEAEQQLVELAVDIAGKILAQEIKSGGYEIDPIVKEALCEAPTREGVVVRLNPDDLSRCESAAGTGDCDGQVRFVSDPGVPAAGCVVETEEGMVESDPQQRLKDVGEALKDPE